ncbi:MAG TPA: mechanosensitive ion channel family protein [Ornithinimicrobium sp.]|uniref:mechanosensitive ion channel family protein n=1 Tax=Ornithinimicrobium sp. TaxID=1977084 RepID=UPI002B48D31B|nr:mechanosensitive ion channel family protein [Ornithinimicrobium sp.]HKJ11426.1 mechanosensitive ion channel family protein [Ornithinimicrobium sp.]
MVSPSANEAAEVSNRFGLADLSWTGLGVGLGLLAGFVLAGFAVRVLVAWYLSWRGRGPSAVAVFSQLFQWVFIVLGVVMALTVVFPSVRPVDILGGLGVVSIAAGIAFQTVLGNMFAGIMILSKGRFRVGDQIGVREIRGTVTGITLNSTIVRTFDGRQVLIPNQVMHSDLVTVQTGYETVRTSVEVRVAPAADPARAQRVAIEAMSAVPDVSDDPGPQALLTTVDKGELTLELRFWSGARQLETREAQHAVITAVVTAFTDAGVALADDIQVIEAGPDLLDSLRPDGADRTAQDPGT